MFLKISVLILCSFVCSAVMASSCNKALSSQNFNEDLYLEAGEGEFRISGSSIMIDDSSGFANFYGTSFLIQNIRLHDLEDKQGLVDYLLNRGYRLSTRDSIVLDEVCRQMTKGAFPYAGTSWSRFESVKPALSKLGVVTIYTERGGFLNAEVSQASQDVETVKDLRCFKSLSAN